MDPGASKEHLYQDNPLASTSCDNMSEEERKGDGEVETSVVEGTPQAVPGVGAFLREERERRLFGIEEIAEITRLRPHMIEAIEREEWERLPPPVFVKGFVRAYARALDLDEQKALLLYRTSAPIEAPAPKPLQPPARKWYRPLLLLLVVGIVAAAFLSLWLGRSSTERVGVQAKKEALGDYRAKEPAGDLKQGLRPHAEQERTVPGANSGGTQGAERPGEKTKEQVPRVSGLSTEVIASLENGFTLVGYVKATTWVRIHVDDQAPREFLFSPGNKPRWKAKKGFSILVGNAGGIEFELNGKRLGSLGRPGEVVRLRFPDDFRPSGDEG